MRQGIWHDCLPNSKIRYDSEEVDDNANLNRSERPKNSSPEAKENEAAKPNIQTQAKSEAKDNKMTSVHCINDVPK